MDATFKRTLVRAWGKRALAPTRNMLATLAAKGYGDDLTPVQSLKKNPGFDPAAYVAEDKATWEYDPVSGKGAFLPDKAKHPNKPNAVPGGWRGYRLTAQDRARFDGEGNGAGIVCRDDPADGKPVAGIDCDITDLAGSTMALHTLHSELAALGIAQFHTRRRGGHRWLVPLRITDGVPAYEKRLRKDLSALERGGAGHQFVALGPHACGTSRYWSRVEQAAETPMDEMPARDELPELTLAQFYKLFDAVARSCGAVYASQKDAEDGIKGKAKGEGGSWFKLLPKADPAHHALPDDRKAVFLAVWAALPNKKDRNAWIGCASTFCGTVRNWSEAEAREAWHEWCDGYEGLVDPGESDKLFDEKWAERDRLSQGWPELVQWAKAELGYSRLRELGVTDEEMLLLDRASGKPVIRLPRANLAENVAEIVSALRAKGVPLLSFGGKVVHPSPDVGSPLVALDRHGMRLSLSQELAFAQYNDKAKDWLPCAIPLDMADLMLSAPARALLPQVKGLLEWPSLRPDGSLLDQPGQDAATGYYLTRTVENLTVPDQPTRKQVESALALLQGLLSEFPFVNPESESAAIAAILHIAARPLMDVVPMLVVTSPSARTGKSYLLHTVCAVALGRPLASVGATQDAKENDKRLAGVMLSGQPIIHLDNIERRLSSPLIAQAIENPEIILRVLSTSNVPVVPNSYSIVANGNNVSVSGDLPARCLYCELDAQAERPEHRQFKRRPLAEILADQGVYLSAALTILRWSMQAKLPAPAGMTPLASFGQWSQRVREPLIHLGMPDPCLTQNRLRAESDDLEEQDVAAFAMLANLTKGKPHTVQELLTTTLGLAPGLIGQLLDVMEDDHRRGTVGRHKLVYWLRKHRGRTLGIVTLTAHQPSHKGSPRQWTFTRPAKARSGAPLAQPGADDVV